MPNSMASRFQFSERDSRKVHRRVMSHEKMVATILAMTFAFVWECDMTVIMRTHTVMEFTTNAAPPTVPNLSTSMP